MTMEGGGVTEGRSGGGGERLLRNGSSDRDFNVEHTRFESIGPLRLAWEPVDMVQQLPLPPQTHPSSLHRCSYTLRSETSSPYPETGQRVFISPSPPSLSFSLIKTGTGLTGFRIDNTWKWEKIQRSGQ